MTGQADKFHRLAPDFKVIKVEFMNRIGEGNTLLILGRDIEPFLSPAIAEIICLCICNDNTEYGENE